MKQTMMKKICCSLFVLMLLGAVMLVLTHTAQNSVQTTEILPQIDQRPVYVECEEGAVIDVSLEAKEDFTAGGFRALLVNISESSRGSLHFTLKNAASEILVNEVVPIAEITPGQWITVPGDVSFTAGEKYSLSVYTDGSAPYFMQVPKGQGDMLPFTQEVTQDGVLLDCGISLGVNRIEPVQVTYGDIFYYSIPFSVLFAALALLCIWAGPAGVKTWVSKIPFRTWIDRYGNDMFLLFLFGCICISIYSRAYVKGVYISADSAGYLREAVNLRAGNGFSYDGLAGYQTWFANWPVLYPVFIAAVMAVTGAGAYLSSKIVAMVTAGLILLLLRKCFGKDAWIYGLCLTNIGYLNLSYYTWSEIPFILFLLCFTLILAYIIKEENPACGWYAALGAAGICCFLTRYYGIFVWIVTGFYLLWMLVSNRKKMVRLGITAFVSGLLCMAYLFMNKMMNGMASGVSRTMWWDDYRVLTDDLIESLLTEFFNIFSLQIPELIEGFPYQTKLFVVIGILAGIALFIYKNCRRFTRESVLIVMAVSYDVIFIAIRYVSSMDSFYFRFFEPGTFLFCIGLLGLLLPYLRGKKGFHFFAGMTALLLGCSVWSIVANGGMNADNNYYLALEKEWDEAYSQIPEKSVVIFSDIDFRSSYYRPDVVSGEIRPQDTFQDLQEKYYGSDYLCIRAEYAAVMLESGEYENSVAKKLQEGAEGKAPEDYAVIDLRDDTDAEPGIAGDAEPGITEDAKNPEAVCGPAAAIPVSDPADDFNLRVVYTDETDSYPPDLYYVEKLADADDWKNAYLIFLELDVMGEADKFTYSLIHIDDDEIPELIVDSGFEAGGCRIVAYRDNGNGAALDVLQTCRRMFDYREKDGILRNYGGNSGLYFDLVYALDEQRWSYVTGGMYRENYDDIRYDEEGNVVDIGYLYTWEAEDVSEETYYAELESVYETEQASEPWQNYYIAEEMRSLLETGDVSSAGHRYELIVDDVTWKEAYEACKNRGGYLATILSVEELERIEEQIITEGETDTCFWVGANKVDEEGNSIGYHWLEPERAAENSKNYDMLDFYNALWQNFWYGNEPSFWIEGEGVKIRINEAYVMLIYNEKNDSFGLCDTVEDILALDHSYAGRIGYICEYDE
ncbi:MAG: hypothetical protein HFI48_07835 [Lachnospiraceae bacterium]|nr:hypothetical protein [Lachnospiraceae bacterium]